VTPDPAGAKPRRRTAAAALLAACALACASATPYRELAEGGAAYADSVAALAGAAAALAADASSERLLQDDALANTDPETLRRATAEDERRAAALARLAAHARLLRRYFALLGDLADGRAGRRTLTAVEAVADGLDAAGDALRTSTGAGEVRDAARAAATGAAFWGRALARREVAARAPLLDRELATHGEMLEALGTAMRHDLEVVATARAQRRVIDPLLAEAPLADPDGWVAARRAALAGAPAPDELGAARRAAAALREAVAAVAERRPALDSLADAVADVEAVRAALAALGLAEAAP